MVKNDKNTFLVYKHASPSYLTFTVVYIYKGSLDIAGIYKGSLDIEGIYKDSLEIAGIY